MRTDKIALLTDSCADIPVEVARKNHIMLFRLRLHLKRVRIRTAWIFFRTMCIAASPMR